MAKIAIISDEDITFNNRIVQDNRFAKAEKQKIEKDNLEAILPIWFGFWIVVGLVGVWRVGVVQEIARNVF